jgi:hypothetical protein
MRCLRITQRLVALIASVVLMASCGGGGGSGPAVVAVYSSLGSLQCSGGGSTLTQLQQSLINLGVQVLASRCGLDGVLRPALCGTPDGRIGIFEVEDAELAIALTLGFALLSTLPNAVDAACP